MHRCMARQEFSSPYSGLFNTCEDWEEWLLDKEWISLCLEKEWALEKETVKVEAWRSFMLGELQQKIDKQEVQGELLPKGDVWKEK